MRNRGFISVVVKTTEMHIPLWYWFSPNPMTLLGSLKAVYVTLERARARPAKEMVTGLPGGPRHSRCMGPGR